MLVDTHQIAATADFRRVSYALIRAGPSGARCFGYAAVAVTLGSVFETKIRIGGAVLVAKFYNKVISFDQ